MAALTGAAGLSWLSIQNTLGWIAPAGLPNSELIPDNGKAIGDEAYRAYQRNDLARAESLALDALRISPASVSALRTLALVSEANGKTAAATKFMNLAERLSRRDVQTQYLLLTRSVQQRDFDKALFHINIVLVTSPKSKAALFPVLAATISDPSLRRSVQELLTRDPVWRDDFVGYLIGKAGPVTDVFNLVVPILDPSDERDQYEIRHLLGRLVQEQRFELAWKTYVHLSQQGSGQAPLLRNGDFENRSRYPYFEWTYTKSNSLLAEQGVVDQFDQGQVAVIYSGSRGVALRQMVLLSPGSYILSFRSYTSTINGLLAPRVRIVCKSGSNVVLGEEPFSLGEVGDVRIRVQVPKDCPVQQVEVFVGSAIHDDTPSWIDDVVLSRQ